jgi:hypothetical protein
MKSGDNNNTLIKYAPLTPVAEKQGQEILICVPTWFDVRKNYAISNAPARTAKLEFSGNDLNFMARVLYAEASGSMQLADKNERDKEKSAIMNVNHFRLNRRGYPSNVYIATTFRMVCEAPNQFESVYKNSPKFLGSDERSVESLTKRECSDIEEAIAAVKAFFENGPNSEYQFDNFRGYRPNGRGLHIGYSRFWLSEAGKKLLADTP